MSGLYVFFKVVWVMYIVSFSLNVQAQTFKSSLNNTHEMIWKNDQATVLPTGDLKWKPESFKFQPGSSVRYIDFENGNDNADGQTTATPWKHHPWDTNATGNSRNCTGVHTYVFKRGVIYRGALTGSESGTSEENIQLTSDPDWGSGEAKIYGSMSITGGWTKCNSNSAPKIPDPQKVYFVDISASFPETKYVAEKVGDKLVQLVLARIPNWEVTDSINPMGDWWQWTDVYKNNTHGQGGYMVDEQNLNQGEVDYWKGGTVWTEWEGTMGTVWGMKIASFDPVKNSISTENDYSFGGEGKRYYIENLPQLLDEPMEYWFDKSGQYPGRLYVRLSDERNPNSTEIEVAIQEKVIQLNNVHDVSISGLSFALNTYDKYHYTDGGAADMASFINLGGFCHDVEIRNCRFNLVNSGISVENGIYQSQNVNNITVSDNEFKHVGDNAITFDEGNGKYMEDIFILRNKIYNSGFRQLCRWYSAIPAINGYFKTGVAAGNFVDFCWGSGIYLHWGKKGSGNNTNADIPFIRGLVFQNRVENTLLGTSDYGGIEHWQGGPAYYYNNYSKNAHGWRGSPKNKEWNPWGLPFYFDGSFKLYAFNNIAVSPFNSLTDPTKRNRSGYQMVLGIYNILANNTSHNFYMGITTHDHSGGIPCVNRFLGNILNNTSHTYFRTTDDNSMVHFDSYVNNVFAGTAQNYWKYPGGTLNSLDQFKSRLESLNAQSSQLGWDADNGILPFAEDNNFLPENNSIAIDNGVKFFAPFPLYAVVGEWHFYPQNDDPTIIVGENFYMTSDYLHRSDYDKIPRNNLKVQNLYPESFVVGNLEDWTKGALHFNGSDTYCTVRDSEVQQSLKCNDLDMTTNDFIIETYLKTSEGHVNSTILSKYDNISNGYALRIDESGHVLASLISNGENANSLQSLGVVNNGEWRHILLEVIREEGMTIYIDGEQSSGNLSGNMPSIDLSLENNADFLIGKDLEGHFFQGIIDFVRVSKGNLNDAQTSIEELYEWEFNGPFLYDFSGKAPVGKRDAGALESDGNTTFSGYDKDGNKAPSLLIYPNPAKEEITVRHNFPGPAWIEIYNLYGQKLIDKIIHEQPEKVNIGSLKPGIFLLKMYMGTTVCTTKILKE